MINSVDELMGNTHFIKMTVVSQDDLRDLRSAAKFGSTVLSIFPSDTFTRKWRSNARCSPNPPKSATACFRNVGDHFSKLSISRLCLEGVSREAEYITLTSKVLHKIYTKINVYFMQDF